MTARALAALAALLALAACAAPPSQQAQVVMTVQAGSGGQKLPEQVAADAQSTINAINIAQAATAEAVAQQTAVAVAATGQAAAQATQVAMATYGAATATSSAATVVAEALQVTQTVQAMAIEAQSAMATATAGPAIATATVAAQSTIDAQEAANIAMLQADTQAKLAQENARYKRVTTLITLAAGAFILAMVTFAAAIVIRLIQLRKQTVIRLEGGMPHLAYDLLGRPSLYEPARPALGPGSRAMLPVAEELPALPAGGARPLPEMAEGNALIVGPTRTGKSTALRLIVGSRVAQPGHQVSVIDPHYRPGAWGDRVQVIGTQDYDEITRFLMWLGSELASRRQQRAQNIVDFSPLTVVLDELPNLVDEIEPEALIQWRRVARQGSKYGMFAVIGSQSTRVKTIGIQGEGDVLENFRFALFLGKEAIARDKGQADLGLRAALLLDAGQPVPVTIPYDPRRDPDNPQFSPGPRAAANGYQAQAPWNSGHSQTAQPARPEAQQRPAWVPPVTAREMPEAQQVAAQVIDARPPDGDHPPHDYGMVTEWGFVAPSQVVEILAAWQAGWSGRATQFAVWGYEGGAAYYMTEAVKDAYARRPLPALATLQNAQARLEARRNSAQGQQTAWAGATATQAATTD